MPSQREERIQDDRSSYSPYDELLEEVKNDGQLPPKFWPPSSGPQNLTSWSELGSPAEELSSMSAEVVTPQRKREAKFESKVASRRLSDSDFKSSFKKLPNPLSR